MWFHGHDHSAAWVGAAAPSAACHSVCVAARAHAGRPLTARRRAWAGATVWLTAALWGCGDAAGEAPTLRDLEGPLRTAAAPGPWPVLILAEGGTPTLVTAENDGPEIPVALTEIAPGVFRGQLPAAPVGALLRYAAQLGDAVLPAPAPDLASGAAGLPGHRVRVVGPVSGPDPPPTCAVQIRTPAEGAVLGPATDAAPQAGVQVSVVGEGSLADGERARLQVQAEGAEAPIEGPDGGFAAEARGGVVAFAAVGLAPGRWTLTLAAQPQGGARCQAAVTVEVLPPLPP